jgi:hypothetical protein
MQMLESLDLLGVVQATRLRNRPALPAEVRLSMQLDALALLHGVSPNFR